MKRFMIIGLIFIVSCLLTGFNGNAQNKINRYQYWFDNDYSANSYAIVSPTEHLQLDTTISLETLTNGLHSFTIRFRDDNGLWSIPTSQFFYYNDLIDNNINSYQYWFDNDFSTNVHVAVAVAECKLINTLLPIETISKGLHLFTIRFKDTKGKWSIPISRYFYKTNKIADNKITAYRYWIDDDIANAKYIAISNPTLWLRLNEDLDLSMLNNGEYTIHFQFKDSSDKWSVVTSDTFTLNNLTAIENTFLKTITAYPNPTTGIINIDLGTSFKTIEVQLYDNLGKKIKQQFYKNEQIVKIVLNNYPTGIFFVRVLADDKWAEFQFIKNKL